MFRSSLGRRNPGEHLFLTGTDSAPGLMVVQKKHTLGDGKAV